MAGALTMTMDERQAFLADVHVGVIAIAEGGRGPLAVPVWYDYEPGGDLTVLMQSDSRKALGIDAAGRFSLCAQSETAPYQYVTVEGPVTATESYNKDDLQAMATRYLGEEGGKAYVAGSDPSANSVKITMSPQRWLSVDYSKR